MSGVARRVFAIRVNRRVERRLDPHVVVRLLTSRGFRVVRWTRTSLEMEYGTLAAKAVEPTGHRRLLLAKAAAHVDVTLGAFSWPWVHDQLGGILAAQADQIVGELQGEETELSRFGVVIAQQAAARQAAAHNQVMLGGSRQLPAWSALVIGPGPTRADDRRAHRRAWPDRPNGQSIRRLMRVSSN